MADFTARRWHHCGMDTPPPAIDDSQTAQKTRVLRQFRVVFGAVRQHFRQVERRAGVGGAMVAALDYIEASPGLRVTELAIAMDVHQSTASNLVRQMVQRGLIRTERDPGDRRSVHLQLEDAGRRVLLAVPGPREGVLPQALARLSDDGLQQLETGLAELLALLPVKAEAEAARTPLANL